MCWISYHGGALDAREDEMFTITIVNREKVKIEGEFTKKDLKWLDETLYHLKPILDDPPPSSETEPLTGRDQFIEAYLAKK
jgi:hypothetical protein